MSGNGKGSLPRPCNQALYEQNYERIFGGKCAACKGNGFHWDKCKLTKKMLKTTCLLCRGSGRCKN